MPTVRPARLRARIPALAALAVAGAFMAAACGSAASPAPSSSAPASAAGSAGPSAASSAAASPSGGVAPSVAPSSSSRVVASLAPPNCDALVETPAQTEGPYFTPGSPAKTDLREPGMPGTTLVVSGFVLAADCTPLVGAKVDVWQADSTGTYDNSGYVLRGHLFSAADGSYSFTTVVPGIYPGRTEHIHVKVTPAGSETLTTQLYFPGVAQNDSDGIFDPAGLLTITETPEGLAGRYDFVL